LSHTGILDTAILQEVGPRDGLQNEKRILSPDIRADLIDRLADAGLPRIQIGSFVNPRLVPQMAGTDEVWHRIDKKAGVRYSVLALNRKGIQRAIGAGIPHVDIYVSVSESHSLKNVGTTVREALDEALVMIQLAQDSGIGVTAGVMCAFGCFYEGTVALEKVNEIVAALNAKSQGEIVLADTAGMADPECIKRTIESTAGIVEVPRLAVHLHNTRGFGIANLVAALNMGVRRFETSICGLGGCPFIPGAAGNVSTEETVNILECKGVSTGIDQRKLNSITVYVQKLLGHSGQEFDSKLKEPRLT
jgi:hydroxymethylglutaryl-CoA lyase